MTREYQFIEVVQSLAGGTFYRIIATIRAKDMIQAKIMYHSKYSVNYDAIQINGEWV